MSFRQERQIAIRFVDSKEWIAFLTKVLDRIFPEDEPAAKMTVSLGKPAPKDQ